MKTFTIMKKFKWEKNWKFLLAHFRFLSCKKFSSIVNFLTFWWLLQKMLMITTFIFMISYQILTPKCPKNNRFRDLLCKRFLSSQFYVKLDDDMSMTHDPNDQENIVQMQVYQMALICWFIAIVGPENDQLLKSLIYPVFCI